MADAFITRRGGIGGAAPKLQTKTAMPTTTQQEVVPDTGYDGLLSVTVNPIPDDYIIPAGTKNITENGTVDVTSFASVAVDIHDVIDVTELPTENIDTTKYYRIDDALYKAALTAKGVWFLNPTLTAPTASTTVTLNLRGTVPSGWNGKPASTTSTDSVYNIFLSKDSIRIANYCYYGTTSSAARIFSLSGSYIYYININKDHTFSKGSPDGIAARTVTITGGDDVKSTRALNWLQNNATLKSGGVEWAKYFTPQGSLAITENGTVDVTNFAEVKVAVPDPDLSDATATPAKILLGETAYTGVGKITGTIPTYDGSLRPMTVSINATGRNFTVYDGRTATGTSVATITAGTSGSVQCKSGYLVLKASSSGFSFSQSTKGGVTYDGYIENLCYKFIVVDDGIINISITGHVLE